MTTILFYSAALILLVVSTIKDKNKTKLALKKSFKSFMNLLPALLPMVLLVGIMLSLISPKIIGIILGDESGIIGITLGLLIGSISFMPSFVAFALGQNLITGGAGYAQVAAFVSSLMAVGITSLTVELKYFSKKITFWRNAIALIACVVFTIIIGMVM